MTPKAKKISNTISSQVSGRAQLPDVLKFMVDKESNTSGDSLVHFANTLVWVLSAFTLGGLYYFAYTDVGVVNAIKMLWRL